MKWTAADIADFLAAFGQTVTIEDGSLQGAEITGIFSAPFSAVNQFDGTVESSGPQVDIASSDATYIKHNGGILIDGTDYVVTGIQNDGTGWTRLYLRERFD